MSSEDDPVSNPPEPVPDLAGLGEAGLIKLVQKAAERPAPRVITGIGDDAAVVATAEKSVLTTDLLVDGTHFIANMTPPRLLGRKAISVNLSDLAAMAASPAFCLIGLAAPGNFPVPYLEEMVRGMAEKASEHGLAIVGGDVCRAGRLTIAVTAIGDADPPGPVYRAGARVGDRILVSGTVGDSALGFARLKELTAPVSIEAIKADDLSEAILKHLDPTPRIELGLKLAGLATSMIDLSDGIAADLPRLLERSGAPGAAIHTGLLPLSNTFRRHFGLDSAADGEALSMAVALGEDYELMFTARAEDEPRAVEAGRSVGVEVTLIGEVAGGAGIELVGPDGARSPMPAPRFNHFGGG